jgi:hypothetical protein
MRNKNTREDFSLPVSKIANLIFDIRNAGVFEIGHAIIDI